MLRVRTVGGLALEVDGVERAVPPGRPGRLALAWLALHPGLHTRSRVAGALWPDVRERAWSPGCSASQASASRPGRPGGTARSTPSTSSASPPTVRTRSMTGSSFTGG